MENLVAELARDEFDPYLTTVGGSGLGILSPYQSKTDPTMPTQNQGQVTPPETPRENGVNFDLDDSPDPLRAAFEARTISELSEWAESRGRWLFV